MIRPSKLQESELQELTKFQEQSETLIDRLGQLAFKRLQIEKEEQHLKQMHEQLTSLELKISKNLKETYGDVQIDLKDGTITYS
jgi:hypothetical protein